MSAGTDPSGPGGPSGPSGLPLGATYWAPQAWLQGAWAPEVLLRVNAQGEWSELSAHCPASSAEAAQAQQLPGPVLPGLVNAHSHAFQRAFVGMAERRSEAEDNFWTWRDRMYGVALRITPEQLHAVATHLYRELQRGGYTQVCEFHYLHHAPDGRPYADEATMARALAQAAQDCGIGLTLLPVLYQHAGFGGQALRADQRRFATGVEQVLRLRDAVRNWRLPRVSAGVAVHSLRAASAHSIHELTQHLKDDPAPLHIHIAEQTAEVDACLAATGARPIEWLAREGPLDARWQLVHATHASAAEIESVAKAGAGVVLCPSTEANLGDGLCDLPRWLAAGVPLSLGSDSHVTRAWPEELRWLDYGQRLALQQRNVAAAPGQQPATAARLFEAMRQGGGAAAGFSHWGLQLGARADLLVLNTDDPALCGMPSSHLLDATVFASPANPFSAVMVAGQWVHGPGPGEANHDDAAMQRAMHRAMQELWENSA